MSNESKPAPASPPASPAPRGEEGDPSPSARDAKRVEEPVLGVVMEVMTRYEEGKLTAAQAMHEICEARSAPEAKPEGPSPSSSPTPAPQGAEGIEDATVVWDGSYGMVQIAYGRGQIYGRPSRHEPWTVLVRLMADEMPPHPPAPASPGGLDLEAKLDRLCESVKHWAQNGMTADLLEVVEWNRKSIAAAPPPRSLEARPLEEGKGVANG